MMNKYFHRVILMHRCVGSREVLAFLVT